MGWGSGKNAAGREVGYSVAAECDEPGCDAAIDRGLAYCCGGMHDGGEHGCGGYFCGEHRWLTGHEAPGGESSGAFMCLPCCRRWEAEHPDPALAEGDVVHPPESIQCPRCLHVSYNPSDVANNYCGACHWWTSDPHFGAGPPP